MGIKADLNTELTKAFNTDLADAVLSFTLQSSNTVFNPATGGLASGQTISTGSWRGVFSNVEREKVLNSQQLPADVEIIALSVEAPFVPKLGYKAIRGNTEYDILRMKQDPTETIYILECVNASYGNY